MQNVNRFDFDSVKSDAIGKFQGIFRNFGIDVGDGRHTKCPICRGINKFRCDDKDGKGTWICTCGAGDGWSLLQKVLGCDFKEAIMQVAPIVGTLPESKIPKEVKANPEALRKLFKASKRVERGCPVSLYLQNRGLNLLPADLRFTDKCYEPESKCEHPAMLAIVQGVDSECVTIHRTYLDVIGSCKLRIEKPKKLMPGLKKLTDVHAAIRLFKPVGGVVGVAEGIETAIACTQRFTIPTWATISSSIMEAFEPPKGIKKVFVFGDNDKNFAGQKSAYKLANRLVLRDKIEVEVIIPDKLGDWLDNIDSI